jgi:hypothetical protein
VAAQRRNNAVTNVGEVRSNGFLHVISAGRNRNLRTQQHHKIDLRIASRFFDSETFSEYRKPQSETPSAGGAVRSAEVDEPGHRGFNIVLPKPKPWNSAPARAGPLILFRLEGQHHEFSIALMVEARIAAHPSNQEKNMSGFTLTVLFTATDTQSINAAGLKVTLVKGSHPSPTQSTPLWLQFSPFETNTLTWTDTYGVYASPDPVQQETPITASSTVFVAESGVVYPFSNHVFEAPQGTIDPAYYAAHNLSGETLTFGLLQQAVVNDLLIAPAPVSAQSCPDQAVASFMPTDTISVFLHKEVDTGTVMVVTESPALTLDMASQPTQSIYYDGNQFVVSP